MASCEKCWNDAYSLSLRNGYSQPENYSKLMVERAESPCTPEEQAGKDAGMCPKCRRNTMHIYCHICMACGFKQPTKTDEE